jgi:hypothetical protein
VSIFININKKYLLELYLNNNVFFIYHAFWNTVANKRTLSASVAFDGIVISIASLQWQHEMQILSLLIAYPIVISSVSPSKISYFLEQHLRKRQQSLFS